MRYLSRKIGLNALFRIRGILKRKVVVLFLEIVQDVQKFVSADQLANFQCNRFLYNGECREGHRLGRHCAQSQPQAICICIRVRWRGSNFVFDLSDGLNE